VRADLHLTATSATASVSQDYTFVMRLTCFAALFFLYFGATSAGGQQGQGKPDTDGFQVPKFELKGKHAKIFDIKDCEYISGITCRIHYNGVLPLPSRVFFTELDENGHPGPRVRLIYPELKPGETGRATFRIHSHPATIVLQGEWKGPWQDPY